MNCDKGCSKERPLFVWQGDFVALFFAAPGGKKAKGPKERRRGCREKCIKIQEKMNLYKNTTIYASHIIYTVDQIVEMLYKCYMNFITIRYGNILKRGREI